MVKRTIFAFFLATSWVFGAVPVILDNSTVNAYVEKLPHEGVLKQEKDGFLYVALPREYVFGVLPLIPGLAPPPYFTPDKAGAHITVASAEEMALLKTPRIPSLGKMISFTIVNLTSAIVEKSRLGSNLEIYMLMVNSPQLEEIRKELNLPPLSGGFNFHITVGIKKTD